MKKVLTVMITIVMLVSLVTVVNAATPNEDMRAFLAGSFTVCGSTVKLSDTELVKVDKYLSTHTLTAEQVTDVKAGINDIVTYINNTGVKSVDKLTDAQKQTVLNKASDTAAVLNLTVSYDSKNQTLNVYENNTLVDTVSLTKKLPTTGGQVVMPLAFSVLAIIAIAGIVVRRGK